MGSTLGVPVCLKKLVPLVWFSVFFWNCLGGRSFALQVLGPLLYC